MRTPEHLLNPLVVRREAPSKQWILLISSVAGEREATSTTTKLTGGNGAQRNCRP